MTYERFQVVAVLFALSAFAPALLSAQRASVANPGFEQGEPGTAPKGWSLASQWPAGEPFQPAAGHDTSFAKLTDQGCRTGSRCVVMNGSGSTSSVPAGNLLQVLPSEGYKLRRIRLTAAMRVEGQDTRVRMWLRLERADGTNAYLENGAGSPVQSQQWSQRKIEVNVSPNVERIVFGFLPIGNGTAWVDDAALEVTNAIVLEEKPEPSRPLTSRALKNLTALARLYGYIRYFHPSDQASSTKWEAFLVDGVRQVEGAASDEALIKYLAEVAGPVAPSVQIYSDADVPAQVRMEGGPKAVRYKHRGVYQTTKVEFDAGKEPLPIFTVDLVPGVKARVPLALYLDASGTLPRVPMPVERWYLLTEQNRAARLTGVMIAWNVFQHFYPYFDVVKTDWPKTLAPALESAATDKNGIAYLSTLRRLSAPLHDGHARILWERDPRVASPVGWDWIANRLVITDVPDSQGQAIARGDTVIAINGKEVAAALSEAGAEISSPTPQLRLTRATGTGLHYGRQMLGAMGEGLPTEPLVLDLEPYGQPGLRRRVSIARNVSRRPVREQRPAPISEVKPGIVYVDLSRITTKDWYTALPRMEKASGLLLDLRGYPEQISEEFLSNLTEQPMKSSKWLSPEVTTPDRGDMVFKPGEWMVEPRRPYLKAKRVFLTDARAISYSETVMAFVEHYRLGEIIGGPTAGTNGNSIAFKVPGEYELRLTGMQVLKPNGSLLHGVGIIPTIPVSRTIAGVAAGRDEVLERGLAELQK